MISFMMDPKLVPIARRFKRSMEAYVGEAGPLLHPHGIPLAAVPSTLMLIANAAEEGTTLRQSTVEEASVPDLPKAEAAPKGKPKPKKVTKKTAKVDLPLASAIIAVRSLGVRAVFRIAQVLGDAGYFTDDGLAEVTVADTMAGRPDLFQRNPNQGPATYELLRDPTPPEKRLALKLQGFVKPREAAASKTAKAPQPPPAKASAPKSASTKRTPINTTKRVRAYLEALPPGGTFDVEDVVQQTKLPREPVIKILSRLKGVGYISRIPVDGRAPGEKSWRGPHPLKRDASAPA